MTFLINYPAPPVAVSLLRASDGVSPEAFLRALDRLGVLKMTGDQAWVREVCAQHFETGQVRAPHLFVTGDSRDRHNEVVEKRFAFEDMLSPTTGEGSDTGADLNGEVKRSIDDAIDGAVDDLCPQRPLARRVLSNLARLLEFRGIRTARFPTPDHFSWVSAKGMPSHMYGLAAFGIFSEINKDLPKSALTYTIAHEACHLAATLYLVGDPDSDAEAEYGPALFGEGLRFRSLFAGLDEAYTTELAYTAVENPPPDVRPLLSRQGATWLLAVLGDFDLTYVGERGVLDRLSDLIEKSYGMDDDGVGLGVTHFLDLAYFAGDLTVYGLMYHTLGEEGFKAVAKMEPSPQSAAKTLTLLRGRTFKSSST